MSRIFISHSSKNNYKAKQLRDWLAKNGWKDVFLDIDPKRGIAPGQYWLNKLKEEAHRCEAILVVVTEQWLASKWCLAELNTARMLGKQIIPLLYDKIPINSLPAEMTAVQIVNVAGDPEWQSRLKKGLERANLAPNSFDIDPDHPPYPGLKALTEKDAAIFFGREAQTVRGLDHLRKMRDEGIEQLFVIEGASGSGKSSFLRAGLWPRLQRDDRNFLPLPVIRPEHAVLTGDLGLIAALENASGYNHIAVKLKQGGLKVTRAELATLLKHDPDGFLNLLRFFREASTIPNIDGTPGTPPMIVLPIDQGEELFAEDGRNETVPFIALLADTMARDPYFIAIIALRSDAYPQLMAEQSLDEFHEGTFKLPPMSKGTFKAVIEGPAKLVDLEIDPLLTDKLLEDAKGDDALPLLAFTLERLYINYGSDGDLLLNEYTAMGGLGGAIEASIKEALENAKTIRELPPEREALEALLRSAFIPHLVDVNEADKFVRRVVPLDQIPADAHPLIELFVAQHLLISARRNVSGKDVKIIEVAHEALLREWSLLARWLEDEKDALRAAAAITRAARDWNANDRRDEWLDHVGERLEMAVSLARRPDIKARIGTLGDEYLTAAHAKIEAERKARDEQRNRVDKLKLMSAQKGWYLTCALVVIPLQIVLTGIAGMGVIMAVGKHHANQIRDADEDRTKAKKESNELRVANAQLRVEISFTKGRGFIVPSKRNQANSWTVAHAGPPTDRANSSGPEKEDTAIDTAFASQISIDTAPEEQFGKSRQASIKIDVAINIVGPKLSHMIVPAFSRYSVVAATGSVDSLALTLKTTTFLVLKPSTLRLPFTETAKATRPKNRNTDDGKIATSDDHRRPVLTGFYGIKTVNEGTSDSNLVGATSEDQTATISRGPAPVQGKADEGKGDASQTTCVAASDNRLLTGLSGLPGMATLSRVNGC